MPEKTLKLPFEPTTVLAYGDTGTGKTPQIGWLAKYIHKVSGLETRYYLTDNGGTDSIQDVIESGIMHVHDCRLIPHPFLTAQNIAKGLVPEITGENPDGSVKGVWKKVDNSKIGLYAYDSFTGIAESMFTGLSLKSAQGQNIGGEGAYNFSDGSKANGWGEVVIGSSNRSHYKICHDALQALTGAFSQLAAKNNAIVMATATVDRGESDGTRQAVIGPKTIGKAITSEVPRWFAFTFHMVLEPKPMGEPDHKMWIVSHKEASAGNALALANRRLPMLAPDHELYKTLPQFIMPADIVKALQVNQDVVKKARELMKKEMA